MTTHTYTIPHGSGEQNRQGLISAGVWHGAVDCDDTIEDEIMPVPIHRAPDQTPPGESCSICRAETFYWTSLPSRKIQHQVALCPHCASRADPQDVPSKTKWCRREAIAHHPTFGEIDRGTDREYPPAPIVIPEDA